MKTNITISIDIEELTYSSDERLAALWHIAQANPAAYGDKQAGQLVEAIGFEIIARFLRFADPELHCHQPRDFADQAVTRFTEIAPLATEASTSLQSVLCTDCIHCSVPPKGNPGCRSPHVPRADMVHGFLQDCRIARANEFCGPSAINFSLKPKTPTNTPE